MCVRRFWGLYVTLERLYLTSSHGHPAEMKRQAGIVAEGGSAANRLFGAYLRIEDPRINGRFRKGIHLTARDIGWDTTGRTGRGSLQRTARISVPWNDARVEQDYTRKVPGAI